jgi:hypothetical protein
MATVNAALNAKTKICFFIWSFFLERSNADRGQWVLCPTGIIPRRQGRPFIDNFVTGSIRGAVTIRTRVLHGGQSHNDSIKDSTRIADYDAYLKYSEGKFADVARTRLEEFASTPREAPMPVPSIPKICLTLTWQGSLVA